MNEKEKFFASIAQRRVCIPCRKTEEGKIQLELLLNGNREQYLPVFLEKDSVTGNFQKENLVEMDFLLLRHTFLELPEEICGMVIEPFAANHILSRQDLMEFDAKVMGMTVEKSESYGNYTLAVPGKLPNGLVKAVCRFCQDQIGVNRLWILLAKGTMEDKSHLLFAVDFFGNRIDLFPKLAETIKPFMKPGQQFELNESTPEMEDNKFKKALVYRRDRSVQ